jgi:hypothetical protein
MTSFIVDRKARHWLHETESQTESFNWNTVLFLRRREGGGTSSFSLELAFSIPGRCLPIPEACCCSEGRRDGFPMHVHQPDL